MDNRSLELCLAHKLYTLKDFMDAVGIPEVEAAALINKDDSVKVSPSTISKCLKYFNCSYEYFFCLVE